MTRYAANTEVTSERSRAEIERTLRRYGADQFGYMSARDRAFTRTETGRVRKSDAAVEAEWEKACRQRWRALALCIKAKLEAVECGITTFETEFMAHIVLPDGSTMADQALPYIARAYESGTMPPLLSFDG